MRKTLTTLITAGALLLTGCSNNGTEHVSEPPVASADADLWDQGVTNAWKRIREENLPGTRHSQIETMSEALCKARLQGVSTSDRARITAENGAGWSLSEARFIDRVIGEEVCP